MKVGPADSMRETKRPYHQMAPHRLALLDLPTRSIGDEIRTGMKRKRR